MWNVDRGDKKPGVCRPKKSSLIRREGKTRHQDQGQALISKGASLTSSSSTKRDVKFHTIRNSGEKIVRHGDYDAEGA